MKYGLSYVNFIYFVSILFNLPYNLLNYKVLYSIQIINKLFNKTDKK